MTNFYLDKNTQASLSLKALLAKDYIDGIIPNTLTLAITVAPDVSIDLVDDLITFDQLSSTALINHTIEFVLQENSTLNYYAKITPTFQEQADSSVVLKIEQNNTVIEKELIFRFIGKNANAQVFSSCYGTGSTIFKFNTLQDHQVEQTTSNLVIKSVLDDRSKIICNNMIRIHKPAQHTNAEQANKNIILGKGARALSIPQLEIEANDVKCKHGAAVSKLDNDHIFYMQSRGISQDLTRQLLIQAFLN